MKQARPSLGFCFLCWLKTVHIVLICHDEFPIKLTSSDEGKDLLEVEQRGLVIQLNSSDSLCLMNGGDPLLFSSVPPQPPVPGPSLARALRLFETAPLHRCNMLNYVKNNLTEMWTVFFPQVAGLAQLRGLVRLWWVPELALAWGHDSSTAGSRLGKKSEKQMCSFG